MPYIAEVPENQADVSLRESYHKISDLFGFLLQGRTFLLFLLTYAQLLAGPGRTLRFFLLLLTERAA